MPADRLDPTSSDGEQRFRADLVAYLDSLLIGELGELPEPTRVALMHELLERGSGSTPRTAAAALTTRVSGSPGECSG
jgi:hypothetical protein